MGEAALRHEAHGSSGGRAYERHRPEETVLHRTVARHFPAFLERAEEHGGLPQFVVREVEEYLRCGLLEHGCVRVACSSCSFERLVAFSCKRRGFCPSCLGRRMAELAVHLEEKVFPEAPVRQWVCSMPWSIRAVLGYHRTLCADVVSAFITEVSRSLKHRAKRELGLASVSLAHTGAVAVVQRADSALRLNVHVHALALDGVYVREGPRGPLVFHALPAPSRDEVEEVAARTARRVAKVFGKHGRSLETPTEDDPLPDDEPALASCYAAAAGGLAVSGERAGRPLLRLVDPRLSRPDELVGEVSGFNVHATISVGPRDRARLERLCRYLLRPPIAQERLELHPSGKLRYSLKKPWSDGSVAVLLEPEDLLSRLCALIPPPRLHMLRYFGVLSSHAARRREVVPSASTETATGCGKQLALFQKESLDDDVRTRRKPWAWLLRHVFQVDMTTCPACGRAMRLLETATTPEAVARLLAKHGLGPRPPPLPPAPTVQMVFAFMKR
ncbi:MAG: transposase [Polyangiaceae bacterium]|nr:transposase [Polyangiaceae bacterium]